MKRRNFLQTAALTGTTLAIPSILSAALPAGKKKKGIQISKGNVILFQGDSITDAGREKTRQLPNSGGSFGGGYAFITASSLLRHYSSESPAIYNRGISGNKVFQLAGRWQEDCLDLKPDVLSILIGVNDYWHKRNGQYDGTVEIYENDYRKLLSRTREALPNIQLVICQPFALPGTTAVDQSWIEPLSGYQQAASKICGEFNGIWVPFQNVFDEALKYAPASWWAPDGVHPSMAGANLMAAAWLKAAAGIEP